MAGWPPPQYLKFAGECSRPARFASLTINLLCKAEACPADRQGTVLLRFPGLFIVGTR